MTVQVSYDRGFGGYSFSAAEIAQLSSLSVQLLQNIDSNPAQIGLGAAG